MMEDFISRTRNLSDVEISERRQIVSIEEINKVKEMITDIFENNAKMTKILEEREAANIADEEQRHRINELLDSFQRLEKRMQKGDDSIQELENMVRDLMPRVEQASYLVMNYTRQLSDERNRCIPRDLSTKGRGSRGQQHNDGCSENLFQRGNSDIDIQNVITGHNTDRNTEQHKSEKKPTFGDDSVIHQSMNSAVSRESSMRMKFKYNGENENGDSKRTNQKNGESDSTYHTGNVYVNEHGFKTRQTQTEVDNRLHYFRKIETKRRENKHTTEKGKEENIAEGIHLGPTHSDNLTRDEAMLEHTKDGLARKSETAMKRVEGNDDVHISSSSKDEALKRVKENPDLAEQTGNKDDFMEMAILMKNNMEASAYIKDVMKKANIETRKGRTIIQGRGIGPNTVLCLDTSGSMAGAAFQEMISLANDFVDANCHSDNFPVIFTNFITKNCINNRILVPLTRIRDTSIYLDVTEHIGVCTFGKKTGVRLHLTNQYDKVKEVLLTLKAEGPSPMCEGIIMAGAACCAHGKWCLENEFNVENRIILISDGKGTPDHWHLIGDTVDTNNATANSLVDFYTTSAGEIATRFGHAVYSVPVGDFMEKNLARVATISGGHIIHRNELSRLVHFAQLQMDVLTMALKFTKGNFGGVMKEINTYMPCIGTRVRRGPNWMWGNQDCKGPGTIVDHNSDETVVVEWDLGDYITVYRYLPGIHDVIVVDEERVLMAGEDIGVGCKVKRGKNWSYGDQDGGVGTVGVVCLVDPGNTVHVRWPNKTVKRYNFGANGRFDVELINRREPNVPSDFILPPRSRESPIADNNIDTRREISSIQDMNRLNQNKKTRILHNKT